MENRKAYEEVQNLVKDILKGKMYYQKEGYQWGAWIIEVDGKTIPLLSNGSGYPDLDKLYVPKPDATNLNDWRSYTTTLKPNALELLKQVVSQK